MKFVIEYNGDLFGPFATEREAADWALNRLHALPWRLRGVSPTPDQRAEAGED